MATGFTDFSGYTADALPSDWTIRYDTSAGDVLVKTSVFSGVTGGKVLRIATSGSVVGYYGASWDAVDAHADRADIELVAKYKFNLDGAQQEATLFGRGSGTALGNSNLYGAGVTRSFSQRRSTERNSGSRTTLSSSSYLADIDVWQWARVRINGTSIKVKHWLDSESEPGTWTFEDTDSSTSAAGFAGFISGALTSGQVDNIDIDVFGYGTGGDAAPKTAGGGDTTAPTLTSPTGTSTGTTTASGTVSTDEGNGTLDAVVTTSATTPSAAQIQAGQDHTGAAAAATDLNNTVSATGSQSVSFTGLTAATTYYVHYVHEDAAANVSTAVTSASFTTDSADSTAPTLTSPTGTQTGQTTADLSVSTDEGNGTLYWVVSDSATPPSVAQIQAGNDSTGSAAAASGNQAVSGTGTQSASATGLTAATTYYAYFQHQDAASNDSTVSASSSFTTAAVTIKGIQLSLKQEDGTTAAASLSGLYYHAWDALNPGGASDANGSTETTDGSGVLEININSFTASVGGEVFLFVYSLDGTEDKDSVCFAGRVPVVDIS